MDFWHFARLFSDAIAAAKPAAEVLQSALTSVGIVLGAWWVFRKREHVPPASVTHRIQTPPIADDNILLHVEATPTNVGQRLLVVRSSKTSVQQVRPVTDDILELLETTAS